MNAGFMVVLVGRPNVGKSSLFNALLGFRRAIVYDRPGTTCDFIVERAPWSEAIDVMLVDSAGVAGEQAAIDLAIDKADAILFVVDSKEGIHPYDREIALRLGRAKKNVLICVNKCDRKERESHEVFGGLGIGECVEISASHKTNLDSIRSWVMKEAAAGTEDDVVASDKGELVINLALIGRPNSGKSTLMNRLCGEDVSLVSPIAHTTRDSVSHEIKMADGRIRLWDTAGMRRPRADKEDIEVFSIHAATRAIRESEVLFLLIDASQEITDQDMRLLNLAERSGKPLGILLNFWDKLDSKQRKHFVGESDFGAVIKKFKILPISGLTGFSVEGCIPLARSLYRQSQKRIKTSRLNQVVRKIIDRNPPPARGLKNFNFLYASQVKVAPPTFVFFMNRKDQLPHSYQTYVANKLKTELGFKGQTVRVFFR